MYEPLEPGKYYHIYNHAVGNLNLFREPTNYEYFSDLYNKPAKPYLQFSKVFNAYAQAYNKMYRCRGTLFQRPFRRIPIEDEYYLKRLIIYINNNPVNHCFCSDAKDYKWTSYLSALSMANPLIPIEDTINWFDNEENFIFMHQQNSDNRDIAK